MKNPCKITEISSQTNSRIRFELDGWIFHNIFFFRYCFIIVFIFLCLVFISENRKEEITS